MAMKPETKRFLTGASATLVAVVLTILCVKQCNDKNDARTERDAARREMSKIADRANENATELEELREDLKDAYNVADSLANENCALTDSLAILNQKLNDCESSKQQGGQSGNGCGCNGASGARHTRPSGTRTNPARTRPARTSTTVTTHSSGANTTTSVSTSSGTNTVTTTTNTNTTPTTVATGVTIGSGAHDNNVTVNNNTVNNYSAPVDAPKTQSASASQTVIITRRVRTR